MAPRPASEPPVQRREVDPRPLSDPARSAVRAAGAVVTRPGREVLLVHRPRYDDWSFPKGKVDRGEHVVAAAVREVGEETGLRVALGVPLASQHYRVRARHGVRAKTVHYWGARVLGSGEPDGGCVDDVSTYQRPGEIDRVAWVSCEKARTLLTYPHDRDTLDEAFGAPRRTGVLIVLRHGESRARSRWRGPDQLRPLLARGQDQARRWVAPLRAYAPDTVVTSPSVRCRDTVLPYVDAAAVGLAEHPELSEEGAGPKKVQRLLATLLTERRRVLLCTHRPVLPLVWKAVGLPDVPLEKGEALVVHHRNGKVLRTEAHAV